MAQRTQQQSLQGTAGVSLAGESKRAKKAGKEDAKLKADPRGQTEKNREEADNHAIRLGVVCCCSDVCHPQLLAEATPDG